MISKLTSVLGALFVFSCSHTPTYPLATSGTGVALGITMSDTTKTVRTVANNAGEPSYNCQNISSVDIKPEILTIELLQKLAECEQYDVLNNLYNHHSLHLDSLPVGYAAGKGAKVFNVDNAPITSILDGVTGSQWKGKMFFPSRSGKETRGMNRIKSLFGPVVPMGSFVSKLIDRHPYVPEVEPGRSLVLLNYAHPARKKGAPIQEKILEQVQVYDLMVAVPGKYGPVFIGKTWLGQYSPVNGEFSAFDKSKLIAWYFLDYNQGALEHQAEVDHFKEEKMSLPLVTESNIRY
jgi:hypothetical protein